MDWLQVDVQDHCSILCNKCNAEVAEIKEIDIYAATSDYMEGHRTYLILKTSHISQSRFRLDNAKITNSKALFMMYLQVIRCASCVNQLGTYFKTANVDNRFVLGRYALDPKFIRIADNHEITLEMFEQALTASMQSMSKKEIAEKSDQNKLAQRKIVQVYRTFKGCYAKLQEVLITENLNVLKQLQQQEMGSDQEYIRQQQQ